MKTLADYKKENRSNGKNVGKNFSPFRIGFNKLEDLKVFLGDVFCENIEKAFKIALEPGIMTVRKQKQLDSLGFGLCFRGFNSHSGDIYVYQDYLKKWYLSIGISNINNAGRGFEIKLY